MHLYRSLFVRFVLGLLLPGALVAGSATAEPAPSSAILQELRGFRQMGRVLYVAAHPDDENTHLIAYFAQGRGFPTAYLSLTRGEGGQNLIGSELGDALGVIRTQELMAARRIDGGRQFFTRARDFGFSKDVREALSAWNHQQVLADVVQVIRTFRPDVIITRFSPEPGGTHGHHTASAVLAHEAFKLAGDPNAFPEQLGRLKPWQPKRLFMNVWRGADNSEPPAGLVRLDVGGYQPLAGATYSEIAARSRSQHKSQGFGAFGGRNTRYDYLQHSLGEPGSVFDGVDTTWARIPGGGAIAQATQAVIDRFDPLDPAASVPALLAIRKQVLALPADPIVDEKRAQLDRIILSSLGFSTTTEIPRAEVVPGETLSFRHTVTMHAGTPVRWIAVRYPVTGDEVRNPIDLQPHQPATREDTRVLPATHPLSRPYWLRQPGTQNMYRIDDASLIGMPENPLDFPVEFVFEVEGQQIVAVGEPVQITRDPVEGEIRHQLEVIPPVSLRFVRDLEIIAPGSTREVIVEATAARPGVSGSLALEAPAGWKVSPASRPFQLVAAGERAVAAFTLTAPAGPTTAKIVASASVGGSTLHTGRQDVEYPHIRSQLLQPLAELKAVGMDLAIRGKSVGYLPGAGDRVGESLERMGYRVTQLSSRDMTRDGLKHFDAVVLGVRAFNTRADLALHLPALFEYVEEGGNVIVQYNTANGLQTNKLAPYDLQLSSGRVTDENAPVTLLAPDHPALNQPNTITETDFQGWIQERGLYFPSRWDSRFTPILASHDPGEEPLPGGLLVARHGKGYFVYTGYSWFRQLPEGVPGAYRLFANLVSLGK